jgi:hypothetical protein
MTKFNIGDKVHVIRDASNASTLTVRLDKYIPGGIYALPEWREIEFTVASSCIPQSFSFATDILGAYLLSYMGIPRGYVYNNALQLITASCESRKIHLNMQYYMEYCLYHGYVTPMEWLEKHKHF